MSSNEFEKSKVFGFASSVDYAEGAIVSKTVLKKESIFPFAFKSPANIALDAI
jgi:hypothetical protein